MNDPDPHRMWADAHAFYTSPAVPAPPAESGPLADRTAEWRDRLEQTPNGNLLTSNAMFEALRGADRLHLLHVTNAFDRITEQGELRPSGGCLVGALYCAPLTATDGGFRMHNLGEYILTREALTSASGGRKDGRGATPLMIEVRVPRYGYRGLAGVDYLRLGSIHLRAHRDLENLLSSDERFRLRESMVNRVRNSAAFLALAATITLRPNAAAIRAFPVLLGEAIPRLPILGYLYFEAVSEYLMLHSRSRHTRELAARGEFNNWLYKRVLFEGFPGTAGRFDLSEFRPTFGQLEQILSKVDRTIDVPHARIYLTERISHLVTTRLFTPGRLAEEWHSARWDFERTAESFGPLLGHLVHRMPRRFKRYSDLYFFFDQQKAVHAWNHWNHMGISLPFNGTMPKGEIGINPAYPNLDYRVWRAELADDGLLHPVEEVPLRLTPRLVETHDTTMRTSLGPAPTSPMTPPVPERELADTAL